MEGAELTATPFGAFLRDVADRTNAVAAARAAQDPAVDRSLWRRLFEPVTPIAGESLRGVVARSCRENYLPNSFGLLQHLGLVHRNRITVSEDVGIDPAELAYAMRVHEDEVRARRYDPLGRGHVSFFGLNVNARRVETAIRRFSPTAFATEGVGLPHFHRATWELRDIPFCLENWDMLQHTCFCEPGGVVQRWSRTATRVEECDKCGDGLDTLEPVPVPRRMRPALGILAALISPVTSNRSAALLLLPTALHGTDRSVMFATIVRLANAIDARADEHSFELPERRLGALHAVCDAVRVWPRGLADLRLARGTTDATKESIRSLWNRLGSKEPARGKLSSSARPLEPTAPGPMEQVKPSKVPAKGRIAADRPVGIRRATEIARLTPEVLHAAWDQRLVTRHERLHGERIVPAFDLLELSAFGEQWRSRRQPASVAFKFGLPVYALEQMAALLCLTADAPALSGTGPHFTSSSIAEFHDAIQGAKCPISDALPLRQVMRLIGGRLKPWGPVFRLLLDREVPFDLAEGRRLVDRIVVARKHAARLASLRYDNEGRQTFDHGDSMVQNDALEVLNATFRMAHLLSGMPSRGRIPKFFFVADVLAQASEIVTVHEIAAVLGTDTTTALQELRFQGFSGHAEYCDTWPRAVLQHLR